MKDFNPTMFMKLRDGNILGFDQKLSTIKKADDSKETTFENVVFIVDYFSEDGFRTIPIKEIAISNEDVLYTWEVEP
jgi:hypothetical protein